MFSDQAAYNVCFEWGADGRAAVGPGRDVIVLIDVLSFGTCVDVVWAPGVASKSVSRGTVADLRPGLSRS